MKTRTLRQTVAFAAPPHTVYEALMDSKLHAKFTGDRATISRAVGGRIFAYGDYIDGTNVVLVPDRKIVQKWRSSDWPEGHYSTATFELVKVDGGTRLRFTQTEVPEEQYDDIKAGWIEYYWDKMKDMFAKQAPVRRKQSKQQPGSTRSARRQ
jgi:activator of HSP90 ATPase